MSHAEPIPSRRPERRAPASSAWLALAGVVAIVSCGREAPKEASAPPDVVVSPAPAAERRRRTGRNQQHDDEGVHPGTLCRAVRR